MGVLCVSTLHKLFEAFQLDVNRCRGIVQARLARDYPAHIVSHALAYAASRREIRNQLQSDVRSIYERDE